MRAFGAEADEHVVGRMEHEAFGQRHRRHRQSAQAEGASATLAAEMGVEVGEALVMLLAAVAVGRTEGILHLPRAIVDSMHQVVRKEKRERAKHARTVDRAEQAFQVAQSEGTVGLGEGLEHQQAVGRGFDVALGEQRLEVVVHCIGKGKNE